MFAPRLLKVYTFDVPVTETVTLPFGAILTLLFPLNISLVCIKLAVAKLPKLAFNDVKLPLKLAVVAEICKLTVKLFVVVLPEISAVVADRLPLKILAVITLAPLTFPPDSVTLPDVLKFPAFRLPVKLAVLPLNSKLTVKLLAVRLLDTFT